MKSKGTAILTALLLGITLMWTSPIAEAQPPYAKWGKIAMQQTMKTYPNAKVVDYLHVGRKTKTPTTSEETFKLLLQENNRMRALLVHIEFETKTEKVLKVRFEETR
ncbi:YqzG/YhdC family protein [Brevibacillus choshinensis]|uniref:YqzG/YhdC family protein n=2 Tax=Brevibacillus choshinensis TaxID=54911 RepID=A0ABX7FPF5_BRECH|nr:YqzG/YhdC family protein [Brevibacillus choshinensis]